MKKFYFKLNNRFTKQQAGFTLVETLVAVLILTMAIGALLTLTAGGFFSIRYAKNEIVANNLLQESLEYIRNTRDTAAINASKWDDWVMTLEDGGCFTNDGCTINPYSSDSNLRIQACENQGNPNDQCNYLYFYPDIGLYTYDTESAGGNGIVSLFDPKGAGYETSFIRTIKVTYPRNSDPVLATDIIITATMEWMNGTNPKQINQQLILTRWNLE